jgi:hypothetical protein
MKKDLVFTHEKADTSLRPHPSSACECVSACECGCCVWVGEILIPGCERRENEMGKGQQVRAQWREPSVVRGSKQAAAISSHAMSSSSKRLQDAIP